MKYHIDFDIDLRRNPYKGKYIVIEGIDGSGKSTQVQRIKASLEQRGVRVLETAEPNTHDVIGKLIREVLSAKVSVPPVAIQYLFSANRASTHLEIIHPALERGEVVISHRCFWSAVAYGMVDREDSVKDEALRLASTQRGEQAPRQTWLRQDKAGNQILIAQSILSMYHQFIVPDYTFYLRVSVDTAIDRISEMGKKTEIYEKREKLEKIAKGYDWLLATFPQEFVVINAEDSVDKVTADILAAISV